MKATWAGGLRVQQHHVITFYITSPSLFSVSDTTTVLPSHTRSPLLSSYLMNAFLKLHLSPLICRGLSFYTHSSLLYISHKCILTLHLLILLHPSYLTSTYMCTYRGKEEQWKKLSPNTTSLLLHKQFVSAYTYHASNHCLVSTYTSFPQSLEKNDKKGYEGLGGV